MKKLLFISIIILSFQQCKKDSSNENETITDVELELTDSLHQLKGSFTDTDGPGGNAPIYDTLKLEKNKIYNGRVNVYDKSNGNNTNVTEEIRKEMESHQFFYYLSESIKEILQISILDKDANSLPVGLSYVINTYQKTGKGTIRVLLSHYPNPKNKSDKPSSDNDIDVEIPIQVN